MRKIQTCKFRVAKIIFLIIMLFISMNANVYAMNSNFVQNPSFEGGTLADGGWTANTQNNTAGATEFKLDENQKHSQSRSLCIINNSPNYSRYSQALKLEKNTQYRVSCWMKTENIGEENAGASFTVRGSNIAPVPGSYVKSIAVPNIKGLRFVTIDPVKEQAMSIASRSMKGTNSTWEYVYVYVKTGSAAGDMAVSLELGGNNSLNTGKVWFDDIVVEKSDQEYGQPLGITMVVFTILFLLAALGYVFYRWKGNSGNKKKKKTEKESGIKSGNILIYVLLALGLVFRIIMASSFEGSRFDMLCFKTWSSVAAANLTAIYNGIIFIDYPPLYVYVLAVLGKIAQVSGLYTVPWAYALLLKFPSIIAELVTAYLIYRIATKHLSNKLSLIVASVYIFNPAVIFDSALWGQVDSFLTLIIAGALVLVYKERLEYASVLFAAAVLTKPQGIIFLPVLLFELIKRRDFKLFVKSFLSGVAATVLIIIPFAISKGPLWIFKLFLGGAAEYPYASGNAYNLFSALGGNMKDDSTILFVFSYATWGYIFIVLITAFVGLLYFKTQAREIPFIAGLTLMSGVYMLSSRMHERYLFPVLAIALLVFIFTRDRRIFLINILFSGTLFFSMKDHLFSFAILPMGLMSVINLLIFGYLVKTVYDIAVKEKVEHLS